VPDLLFSKFMPQLGNATALAVLLQSFWRINRRRQGSPPAVRADDLVADGGLRSFVEGLGVSEREIGPELSSAIELLVKRELLIEAWTAGESGPVRWLFINGTEGRQAYDSWRQGGLVLPDTIAPTTDVRGDRPSVFALYEQNIGVVTPMLAEELRSALEKYPESWIEDALRLAVENNARSWSYAHAILERWWREGRTDEANRRSARGDRKGSDEGPYSGFVRH